MALDPTIIQPRDLPAAGTVVSSDDLVVDTGASVQKAKPIQIVNAAAPIASSSQAIAGADNTTRMTPLRTKQAIDVLGKDFVDEAESARDTALGYRNQTLGYRNEGREARDGAQDAMAEARDYAAQLTELTASAETLSPGEDATASYTYERIDGPGGEISAIISRLDFGIPRGDQGEVGPKGDAGAGLNLLGSLDDESELPVSGDPGDAYLIDGDMYVWNGSEWDSFGNIQGPPGTPGPDLEDFTSLTLSQSFTGNGNSNPLELSQDPITESAVMVFVEGVFQPNISVSGNEVFPVGFSWPSGAKIDVRYFSPLSLVDIAADDIRGLAYPTRAAFVADVAAGYAPADGTVVTAGGVQYVAEEGATALPGFGGWLPFGVPSFKHFGAACDGVTNDTAAFVATCDYASANDLMIDGGGDTLLIGGAEMPGCQMQNVTLMHLTTDAVRTLRSTGGRVYWRNVSFDGQSQAVEAFVVRTTENPVLDNVRVTAYGTEADPGRPCVVDQDVTGLQIRGGHYREMWARDMFAIKSRHNTISGVTFENRIIPPMGKAIRLGRLLGDTDQISGDQTTILGCNFYGFGNDTINCELDSQYVTISACTFEKCRDMVKADFTGVDDKLVGLIVTGCTLKFPFAIADAFTRGISAIGCPNVNVSNCFFDMRFAEVAGVLTPSTECIFAGGVGSQVSNCTIIGETSEAIRVGNDGSVIGGLIKDFTTAGVRVVGSGFRVSGVSMISEIATYGIDAGGSSLLNASSNNIDVDGTGIRTNSSSADCLFIGNIIKATTPINGSGTSVEQYNNKTI